MEASTTNAPRFTREERADGRTPVASQDLTFVPTPIADPGPLGLAAFALTTFVLSMFNANLVGAGGEPVVFGLAFAYGGIAQFAAGMWEFRTGNTFGAVAFTSYGAFWLSFWAFVEFFEKDVPTADAGHAVGLYLIAWGIFTLYMFVASLRTTAAIAAVFALLTRRSSARHRERRRAHQHRAPGRVDRPGDGGSRVVCLIRGGDELDVRARLSCPSSTCADGRLYLRIDDTTTDPRGPRTWRERRPIWNASWPSCWSRSASSHRRSSRPMR